MRGRIIALAFFAAFLSAQAVNAAEKLSYAAPVRLLYDPKHPAQPRQPGEK